MLREAVDLRGEFYGDGELRRQVGLDEVPDYLEDCIMPMAILLKIHNHGTVVEDVGESLS